MHLRLFTALFIVALCHSSYAALMIDDFDDGSQLVWSFSGSRTSTNSGLTGVLGGSRQVTVSVDSIGGVAAVNVAGSNQLNAVFTVSSNGSVATTYDAGGTTLGPVDLTGGGQYDSLSVDLTYLTRSATLSVELATPSGKLLASRVVNPSDAGSVIAFGFGSFSGTGSLENVDLIRLRASFDVADDTKLLSRIGLDNFLAADLLGNADLIPNPEPASIVCWSLCLMGMGLIAGIRARRHR